MTLKEQIVQVVKDHFGLVDRFTIDSAVVSIRKDSDDIEVDATFSTVREDGDPSEIEIPKIVKTKRSYKKREPKTSSVRHVSKREQKEQTEKDGSRITDAQIKGWRATLWARQNAGVLTAAQIEAVKATKGTHAHNMSPEQRQQIKDIFDDTTPARY